MNKERNFIPIAVSVSTHERLKRIGRMGDTFDIVIGRLLDSKLEQETTQ